MIDFFANLFSADFMPHGHCYRWTPEILWLHVVSDAFITLSYYFIPVALVYFVSKRRMDLPFTGIFLMFGAFIVACGTTHLLEIWSVWNGAYRLTGVVKLFTAAVSVVTAAMLLPLIPQALALRSPKELEEANRKLEEEVNERRQAEEALRKAEQEIRDMNRELEQRVRERTASLQAANEELESISYTVSHDLRAPIRHISSFAALLSRNSGEQLDEKGKRYLEKIIGSGEKMGHLIDNLLEFSRLGRVEMKSELVDMAELAQDAVEDFQASTQDRKIQWSVGELPSVRGDLTALQQVWSNLIGNAVKYTAEEQVAEIEIGSRPLKTGDVEFFVRDNGVGFGPEFSEKAFGVFQRWHDAGEFEGTGIGLASVRRTIQRHGGDTRAIGEVGKGAEICFVLPQANHSVESSGES